ncbi:trehalase-like isoform X4 [Bradysia coprophila]|uniref:trehalase-like isoform X4 n=1 Tax=Bradysia coprophila TaxID=38358 RepID=UPI00187DD655|nr:trehalase-like isoform X4 [Bradysia coprophila]
MFCFQTFRYVRKSICISNSKSRSDILNSSSVIRHFVTTLLRACENREIYCYGELLDTVQMAKIFPDSKTFVDMKLKQTPAKTLELFKKWQEDHPNYNQTDVESFVNSTFDEPGSEFETWVPSDHKENPAFLTNITDADYRQWASDLNTLWLQLGRKMKDEVKRNQDLYSIIYVDHPVIVPGGRFREFYYWDSYWIVKGLLHCEMYTTVKGMLTNFLDIVQRFGFVPNGGRIYYSGRSQPPLLTAMVKAYHDATGDTDFLRTATPVLEREFQYWLNNHTVIVNDHVFAVYGDTTCGPRPESYYEDKETGVQFATDIDKENHYSELKAAAESGMDFSSRWFINNGTNQGTLVDLKCRSIVPVDLNAFLFSVAKNLAQFSLKLGNETKAAEYEAKAQEMFDAIHSVLWHDDVGAWLDYDLENKKRRDYFVPSNLVPLYVGCYNKADEANVTEKVLSYIERHGLNDFIGGVPNTLERTGEQWDFPNVWPPMQHMLIEGLANLNDERAQTMSLDWAARWTRSNFLGYKDSFVMYEKYSALELGGHGGGGEYDIQIGFGWTNGVIMDLLAKYGKQLSSTDEKASANTIKTWAYTGFLTTFVAVLVSIVTRSVH